MVQGPATEVTHQLLARHSSKLHQLDLIAERLSVGHIIVRVRQALMGP